MIPSNTKGSFRIPAVVISPFLKSYSTRTLPATTSSKRSAMPSSLCSQLSGLSHEEGRGPRVLTARKRAPTFAPCLESQGQRKQPKSPEVTTRGFCERRAYVTAVGGKLLSARITLAADSVSDCDHFGAECSQMTCVPSVENGSVLEL